MHGIYEEFKQNINIKDPNTEQKPFIKLFLKELLYKLRKENLKAYKLNDKYLPIKQSVDNLNEYYIDFELSFRERVAINLDKDCNWADEDASVLSNIIINDWGFPRVEIVRSSERHHFEHDLIIIRFIVTLYFENNLTSISTE